MTEKYRTKIKRKSLAVVFVCAAVLLILIFLRWTGNDKPDMETTTGRCKFISSLGWTVEADSEEFHTVLLPENMGGVMKEYCALQKGQDFDLEKYAGSSCDQFTYKLCSYPGYDGDVYITLYILSGELIAGDIHTADVNGFMRGIYADE